MQIADKSGETLTPRTGVPTPGRPEDTAGGRVAPKTRRDVLKWGLFGSLLVMLGAGTIGFLDFYYPRKVGLFGSKITAPYTLADIPVNTVLEVQAPRLHCAVAP